MSLDIRRNTETAAHDQGIPVQYAGATIYIRGPLSGPMVEFDRQRAEITRTKILDAEAEGKPVGNISALFSSKEYDDAKLDRAVAATIRWEGVTEDGDPCACTADAARALYKAHPSLLDIVTRAATDAGKFYPAPQTSSAKSTDAPSGSPGG